MYYEIYIDRIFLINFVLNLFLLTLTAKTLNRTATRMGILGGSAAGALGYCIVLCLPLSYFSKIVIGLIPVSVGMVKLTFRSKGYRQIARETGYLFVYAFLIGGFMLFMLKRFSFFGQNSGKVWCVLGLALLAFVPLDILAKKYRNRKSNPFCQVSIPCQGREVKVTALIDTGNGLREPVSGRPVSILEEKVWEQLRPLMRDEKMKVIPFHSVGKPHGLMKGYELNLLVVEREAQKTCYEKVIVGVCDGQISSGKHYQMILHPELLEKAEKNKKQKENSSGKEESDDF